MIRKKERSNRLCFIRLNYSLLTVVEIPLIRIACDTFSAGKYKGIRYLDVTTVYTKEKNSVIINVVNRHKDKAVTTEIVNQSGNFSGKPSVTEVTANDLSEGFSFDKQKEYIPASKEATAMGNKIVYSFPPHSFTQIIVKVD